ncbi:MAG TPA: MFS transporter [Thermoanaerobaculia bacterium]
MTPPAASARPTRVRWLVLALICLMSFVAYVLRSNMSVAGVSMIRDLGLSDLQLGAILAAFAWGYAIFQLPGGVFGEVFGARKSMTWLALSWGILTFATGLVPGRAAGPAAVSLGLLVLLRFGMGVAQAPFYPVTSGVSIARWFPAGAWGLANSLGSTALTLGAAAAGPGVAWLVGAAGWRNSFLLAAPLGALTAGLWWSLYRESPAEDARVNEAERDRIASGAAPPEAAPPAGVWKAVARDRDVLAITASYFCVNYVFYLFFNWFYYYLVDVRGLSPQVGGYFTGAQWMVGAVSAPLGGWLGDRLTRRLGPRRGYRITIVGGMLLCAPLLVAGALAKNATVAVTLLSLSFGATQLVDGPYWAAGMRIGGAHGAVTTGLMNTGGNVVGGVGALLVPLVARGFGWPVAISTGALFALAAAVLWIWIRADRTFGHAAAEVIS